MAASAVDAMDPVPAVAGCSANVRVSRGDTQRIYGYPPFMMLAIGLSLMKRPRLPFGIVRRINAGKGLSVLRVEQNADTRSTSRATAISSKTGGS